MKFLRNINYYLQLSWMRICFKIDAFFEKTHYSLQLSLIRLCFRIDEFFEKLFYITKKIIKILTFIILKIIQIVIIFYLMFLLKSYGYSFQFLVAVDVSMKSYFCSLYETIAILKIMLRETIMAHFSQFYLSDFNRQLLTFLYKIDPFLIRIMTSVELSIFETGIFDISASLEYYKYLLKFFLTHSFFSIKSCYFLLETKIFVPYSSLILGFAAFFFCLSLVGVVFIYEQLKIKEKNKLISKNKVKQKN